MLIAHQIDAEGYFVGDLVLTSSAELQDGMVSTPVPQPCIKPRWDGEKWVEEDQEVLDRLLSPEREINHAKRQALAALNNAYNAAVAPMVKTYPITEIQSWTVQEAEADSYQAWVDAGRVGDAPATPKLDRILAGRNGVSGKETIDELVGKVLAKVEQYSHALDLMGRRQRGENLIASAKTVEAVQAVTWESLTAA